MAAFCLSRWLVQFGYPQSYPQRRRDFLCIKNKKLKYFAKNSVKKYPLRRG